MLFWKTLMNQGLSDDRAEWDWTTRSLRSDKTTRARVYAKSSGVWAAQGLARVLPRLGQDWGWDDDLKIKSKWTDGQNFKKGDVLVEMQGSASVILRIERPFLNLASYACGIATQTRELVQEVERVWKKQKTKHPIPRVTSTRKILPYYRDLALHSLLCGGGFSHRSDLASGILLKENHIARAGGVVQAMNLARMSAPHLYKIEIEVTSLDELKQALDHRADVVMLDNFKAGQIKRALKIVDQATEKNGFKTLVEVSGGLSPSSIGKGIQPGVDILSSGWLTHSVKACDLSLLVE